MTASTNRGGTPRSIGEIVNGRPAGKARRTFQPVRRNSYHAGEREDRFWSRVEPDVLRAQLEAARQHNLVTKQPGKRNGVLGHIALEVLAALIDLVDWKTGRLEPSIAYLQNRLKRSRDAVVRALKALKNEGFLEWIRRTEPVEAEGPGPRVRQITNAYRIATPAKWAERIALRVRQWIRGRQKARGEEPAAAAPRAPRVPSPELAASLGRLEAALDKQDASTPNGQNPCQHQ